MYSTEVMLAVDALADECDLDPNMIKSITIEPNVITVARYVPDDGGHKHIDLETGQPVMEELSLPFMYQKPSA